MGTIIVTPTGLRAAAAAVGRSTAELDEARDQLAQQLTVACASWSPPAGDSIQRCGAAALRACERLADAHRNLARALDTIADGQERLESSISAATGSADAPAS